MNLKLKFIIILSLVIIPIISLAESIPDFPMAFWGTATINGQPLPDGTKIKAFCENNLIGEVTMPESGFYGYTDSTKTKLLVSNCSGNILFKYLLTGATTPLAGGSEIKYTNGFVAGTTVNKNLDFITGQSCNITNGIGKQTWNGSVWGDCTVESCDANYHQDNNSCVSNSRSCNISNGTGNQTWNNDAWGDCTVGSCSSGYHQSGNTCIADSTGGGGGGGGGGGSAPPASSQLSAEAQKVDANKDNKIDVLDFNTLMVSWGKTESNNIADFNKDGKVDLFDFNLLMINWTK